MKSKIRALVGLVSGEDLLPGSQMSGFAVCRVAEGVRVMLRSLFYNSANPIQEALPS